MKDYIGLTLEKAQTKAENENRPFRVMKENGVKYFGTADFNPNRLNFEVENNIITNVYTG